MTPFEQWVRYETRRQFFSRGANSVGWAALASLMGRDAFGAPGSPAGAVQIGRAHV